MLINYHDKTLDKGIKQLKKSGYIKEESKLNITATKSNEKGYGLIKKDDDITITYHKSSDFYKALAVALSSTKKVLNTKSKPIGDDLGLMVDCSRNAVVRVEYLKSFIEEIALLGYTYIGLYTEDTIEVENEPYFGYQRGRLTHDEISEIIEFSSMFNIEVVPYIQTLAHMNAIFKWPEYWPIRDTSDILLPEDERTYELLENIFKSVRKIYKTNRINIGMDEAYLLGYGRYREIHGIKDRNDIMKTHLEYVMKLCKKYNFEPEMWFDMFFRIAYNGQARIDKKDVPESIKEIVPKGLKIVYWEYLTDEHNRYDDNLKMNFELSDNVGFAGGAWKWQGFAPNNHLSERAGRPAFKACRAHNVKDVLVTAWGDDGGEASLKSIAASLILFSELYDKEKEDLSITDDLAVFIYGYTYEELRNMDLPDLLYDEKPIMSNPSRYVFYNDILTGSFDYHIFDHFVKKYEKTGQILMESASKEGKLQHQFKTLAQLSKVNGLKSDIIINLKTAYDQNDKDKLRQLKDKINQLNDYLNVFYNDFKTQWHAENKPFGFEVQDIRIGGMTQRNRHIIERLDAFIQNKVGSIPELDAKPLPFHGLDKDKTLEEKYLFVNLWKDLVSPSNF